MRKISPHIFSACFLVAICCQASAQQPSFPLKASNNKRYLVGQDNAPFFLAGDAAWRLGYKVSFADAQKYLADRKLKGFNTVFLEVTPDMPGDANQPDINGEHPFILKDISQPNEKYFRHFDSVLSETTKMGMAVILFPMYNGCCNDGWIQILREPRNRDTNKLKAYGKWIADRYRNYPNIIWASGGDLEVTPEAILIAEAIAANDSVHLHTYHTNPVQTSTGALPGVDWVTLSMVYTYFPELAGASYHMEHVYTQLYREQKRNAHVPYFMAESSYEGEREETTQIFRRQAYWAVTGGACGHIYGNRFGWQLIEDWKKSLSSKGSESMKIFNAFVNTVQWYDLIPDWAHTVIVSGRGYFNDGSHPGGEDYVTAALSEDRKKMVAYLPSYRSVTINTERFEGESFRVTWFDPTNGKRISSVQSFAKGGVKDLLPPSVNNGDGFQDWVLIIEALPQPREGYTFLFNGQDLSGWKKEGPATWMVNNGEIIAIAGSKGGMLVTNKSYDNFTLLSQFKVVKNGNGGVLFHISKTAGHKGWKAVIDSNGVQTGGVLNMETGKWMGLPAPESAQYFKKDSWNDFHLRMVDGEIWTWINGHELVHIPKGQVDNRPGTIALQVDGDGAVIQWRDIQVQEGRP